MDIDRSIQAVRHIFKQFPALGRPDEELLQLLELYPRNNEFQFAGRLFFYKSSVQEWAKASHPVLLTFT